MQFQFTIYSIILIISSLISLFLSYSAWKRRKVNSALYLSLLFLLVAEWSLTSGMELASADLASKIFWAKLSYIGIVNVAPMWFLFILDYTQNQEVIKRPRIIFLFLIPIACLYLAFTNEWHGLIWPTITTINTSEGIMIIYGHGPAAITSAIYSYILMLAGLVLIGQNLFRTSPIYQRQAMMVFLAALIPLLANSLYAAGLSPFFFDPTPLAVTVSGILILWSIFWYKLLDVMPPAYKSLFDSMKNGVMVLDTHERIMDINQAGSEIFGLDNSCIGINAKDKLEMWGKISPKGKNDGKVEIKLDKSEIKWLEVQFTPIYRNGLFSGWIYIFEDISHRKSIENHIKKSEKKYRELADMLPQTVFETDVDANLTFMNVYAFTMFGYTHKDLENGLNILELIVEEERSLSRDKIKEVLNGQVSGDEYTALRNNETKFPIIIHSNPIFHDGVHEGFRGIIIDISELKNAEERIIASLKEKEVLLQEIHHRVKNNMQIISSLLSLQANHTGSKEATDVLKESRGRVKSMAMIHEKLYHSHNLSQLNMAEYLKNLVRDILRSYSSVSSNISADVDVGDVYLNIDTAIPMGLLVNELVSNSVKHAFPDGNGNIKVKLESCGADYILTVSDNGIGLPKGLDPLTSSSLGLQLVMSLSIQLEGDLNIQREGKTLFTLTFRELKYSERMQND
jgi:PAS domain S-box-containing protein